MWLINLAPLVREMELDMEKSEIVGYEPLVNDLKLLINKKQYITSLFTFYYNQTVKTIKSYEKLISPEIN